jgi:hypothetical protein
MPLARAAASEKVAFHYAAIFNDADIDWYTRFRLVVTGGFLTREQSRRLLDRGCGPIAYEWSSGFYPGDWVSAESSWQAVMRSHPNWLLNAQPLGGGAAMAGKSAFWYDFANPDLVFNRAAYLGERVKTNRYSGIFLDTLGFEYLPGEVQHVFTQRHPGVDYNRAQAGFLEKLRHHLGPRVLFLNQGYRQYELFLPYADYDLTESYFAAALSDRTHFRSLYDPDAPWDSILTPMEQLVAPASRRFPRVRFVHLGYAAGLAEEISRAIRYNYAAAKLWNHDAYLVTADPRAEQDAVYFAGLGRPLTASYVHDTRKNIAWREFEGGIVALNSGSQTESILNGRYQLPDPPRGFVFLR